MYFTLSQNNGLAYQYQPPAHKNDCTFVCFNPLTGDKAMWEDGIGPDLIKAGHGVLTWNLRGQAGSDFTQGEISQANIVTDAVRLIAEVVPQNPVFVGLSVGGLYAAKAYLLHQIASVKGFVLINTLRSIGPRLDWINAALVRLAQTGGLDLLRDVYLPLLLNEDWQADNRADFLKSGPYTPIATDDGALHLLKAGAATSWDVNWQDIKVPVLNITGMQDRIFRDDSVIEKMLECFADVKAVQYANAGHMIPGEDPGRLAGDLIKFVETL
jgi:pimeloyl-ACP methyl ester carboxylesterase